jgi:alcohol dehydrogenase class IV
VGPAPPWRTGCRTLDRAASAANRASTPPARDRRGRDGVDALAHAIESYVARRANPISDRLAESAFGLIAEHLPAAVAGDPRPEVLEGLSLAALLGGCNVATASTCLPHRMQQAMGAVPHADISHGRGLAVLYPAWLRRSYPHAGPRFDRVAGLLGGGSQVDVVDAVHVLPERISLGLRLRDHGFRKADIDTPVAGVSGNVDNDPIAGVDSELYRDSF